MKSLKNSKKVKLNSKKTKKVNKNKNKGGGGGGIKNSIKRAWNHRPSYYGSRLEKGVNSSVIPFGKFFIHGTQPSSRVVKSATRVFKEDLQFTKDPHFRKYYKDLAKDEKKNLIALLTPKKTTHLQTLKGDHLMKQVQLIHSPKPTTKLISI